MSAPDLNTFPNRPDERHPSLREVQTCSIGVLTPEPVWSGIEPTRESNRQIADVDPSEPATLLFLGGCALAILAGCGLRVERFMAYWSSFEDFVRAMMG